MYILFCLLSLILFNFLGTINHLYYTLLAYMYSPHLVIISYILVFVDPLAVVIILDLWLAYDSLRLASRLAAAYGGLLAIRPDYRTVQR